MDAHVDFEKQSRNNQIHTETDGAKKVKPNASAINQESF